MTPGRMIGIESRRGRAVARSGSVLPRRQSAAGARRPAWSAAAGLSAAFGALMACAGAPAPRPVSPTPAADPRELGGVASDGTTVFVARATLRWGTPAITAVEAIHPAAGRPAPPRWHTELAGYGGRLALAGAQVIAAIDGPSTIAGLAPRGKIGAAITALNAATGAVAWKLLINASEQVEVTSLASIDDGVIVGGSYFGTLRVGTRELSSAGRDDGFVARLTATGEVAWLVRVGGPGSDAVRGVAVAGDRVAIAGTCEAGADLLGKPLQRSDERSGGFDALVAELDAAGALRWAQTFSPGNENQPMVAGVAIDARGRIAVAANVRGTVHTGGARLSTLSPISGLVAWWLPGGVPGPAIMIGAPGEASSWNRLRTIAAVGDRIVVAGAFAGSLPVGDSAIGTSGGCELHSAGFSATLDADGARGPTISAGSVGMEGVRAIAAAGERVIIAAFSDSARELQLHKRNRAPAARSDEIFVTEPNDGDWIMMQTHGFTGDGHTEITDLVPIPGGFVAGAARVYVSCPPTPQPLSSGAATPWGHQQVRLPSPLVTLDR
jgi:outer membrane protein assembly factor BamB